MFREERKEVSLTKFPMKYGAAERDRNTLVRSQSQVQMSSPKLLTKKKEPLPPIDSPFLKKTVFQLFHDKSEQKKLGSRQKKDESESSCDFQNDGSVEKRQIFFDNKESQSVQKITKSFSEIKQSMKNTKNHNFQQMKNTVFIRPSESKRRNTTEVSDKSKHNQKKNNNKILKIREKVAHDQDTSRGKLDNVRIRQVRPVNNVLKQKINRELYVQEKEQIKLVRNLMRNGQERMLSNFIRVKNYTKFMPGVISIES